MDMKKKVLLSFVGKRDPYDALDTKNRIAGSASPIYKFLRSFIGKTGQSDTKDTKNRTPGAVLSILSKIKPDIVYLFPSSKNKTTDKKNETESRAYEIEEKWKQTSPDCDFKIKPLEVVDVTDFAALSLEFDAKIRACVSELGGETRLDDYEFHLNCSSGTQQMTAIAYVLANTGLFSGITRWQVKDPKYVAETASRVTKIKADVIAENSIIQEINNEILILPSVRKNLKQLARITSSPERREKAKILEKMFAAYYFMDILRYKDAYEKLNSIDLNAWPVLEETLRPQKDFLSKLQSANGEETAENLTDLFFNMRRCHEREAYADVLARFWRMGEGSFYYRLKTTWGINPRDIYQSPNKANLKKLQEINPRSFEGAREALVELEDQNYINKIEKIENKIFSIKRKRNKTIVAHGMQSVSKEDADQCIALAEVILLAMVEDSGTLIQNFPFKKEHLQKIVNIL